MKRSSWSAFRIIAMRNKDLEAKLRLVALQLENWKKLHDLITYGLDKAKPEFVLKLLKKRLFSSPAAFAITLEKHARSVTAGGNTGNGNLNAPWGMVMASESFNPFQNDLLVGNFGDGRINAYDPNTGAFVGTLTEKDGTPLDFEGLWDLLQVNNGLYFTAGIGDEDHGLFGVIQKAQSINNKKKK